MLENESVKSSNINIMSEKTNINKLENMRKIHKK
jgi:hypothetical protein